MSRDIRFLINRSYVLRALMGEQFDPAEMMKQNEYGVGQLLRVPHGQFMADAWETGNISLKDYAMPHIHRSRFHIPIREVMLHTYRLVTKGPEHAIAYQPDREPGRGALLWNMGPWHPNRTVAERHYCSPPIIAAADQKTTYTEVGVYTELRGLVLVTHARHELARPGAENFPASEDPMNPLVFTPFSKLWFDAKENGQHPRYIPPLDYELFTHLFPSTESAA